MEYSNDSDNKEKVYKGIVGHADDPFAALQHVIVMST